MPRRSPTHSASSAPSPLSAALAPPSATPCAAPCSAPSRRRGHRDSHRGRAPRVPVHLGRGRGRNRHHPEPQAGSFQARGRRPKALYLRADQPGVVTSGMIEADGDVEILDKNIYIATLSEGGKLDMEMRLSADAAISPPTRTSTLTSPGLHPRGLGPLAGAPRQLCRRSRPPGPDHRL